MPEHLEESDFSVNFPDSVDGIPTVTDNEIYIDAVLFNKIKEMVLGVEAWLLTYKNNIEAPLKDSFTGAEGEKVIAIPVGRYPAGKTVTAIDADLIAGNIISGKTIFGVSGNVPGTIRDSFSGGEGEKVISIPSGSYASGKTVTAVDGDLIAENIKTGVTIFGVEGNLSAGGAGVLQTAVPTMGNIGETILDIINPTADFGTSVPGTTAPTVTTP